MKTGLLATAITLAMVLGLTADAMRPPTHQFSARCYQMAIHEYHVHIHPITSRFIRCRYRPTCSNYSSIAVARFGIARGLKLTALRLLSCRQSVPFGTTDPVPPH